MFRIKELREEKGWNQNRLALELNVSQSTISFYETGERSPDLETLIQLANLFDVNVDYLVGRSATKKMIFENELSSLESNILANLKGLTKEEQKQVEAFVLGLLSAKK